MDYRFPVRLGGKYLEANGMSFYDEVNRAIFPSELISADPRTGVCVYIPAVFRGTYPWTSGDPTARDRTDTQWRVQGEPEQRNQSWQEDEIWRETEEALTWSE